MLSNVNEFMKRYTSYIRKLWNSLWIVSSEEVDKKVMLSVHDTGIGISPDETSRIFERFYRADKSRSVPGAGLGLSLVQAIVRSHGGEIKVSSSPGVGSTFTVFLPLNAIS
jgi:signal transduction histidine kinase